MLDITTGLRFLRYRVRCLTPPLPCLAVPAATVHTIPRLTYLAIRHCLPMPDYLPCQLPFFLIPPFVRRRNCLRND